MGWTLTLTDKMMSNAYLSIVTVGLSYSPDQTRGCDNVMWSAIFDINYQPGSAFVSSREYL